MAADLLQPDESAAWALAFCGGRHDREAVLQGLRSRLGEVPIVGGAAVGTITPGFVGYSSYECSVAVFPDSIPRPTIVMIDGLDGGETETGRKLGLKLRDITNEGDTVLLFYDSIRSAPPPALRRFASHPC